MTCEQRIVGTGTNSNATLGISCHVGLGNAVSDITVRQTSVRN